MAAARRLDFTSETVGDIFPVLRMMHYGDLVVSKKRSSATDYYVHLRDDDIPRGDGSVMRKIRRQ